MRKLALLGIPAALAQTAYQELYFNQTLDHFHPEDDRTWPQRYLFSDEFWDGRGALPNGCPGPILLYTGNEGAITGFWEANGFMTEHLAPKWGGLLVFPEERFYGESQPFGNASATRESRAFLTTEQVLEDIVALLCVTLCHYLSRGHTHSLNFIFYLCSSLVACHLDLGFELGGRLLARRRARRAQLVPAHALFLASLQCL